jgi:hypothetical protein
MVLKLGQLGKWIKKIHGKFLNVLKEKGGEDQLDRSYEK